MDSFIALFKNLKLWTYSFYICEGRRKLLKVTHQKLIICYVVSHYRCTVVICFLPISKGHRKMIHTYTHKLWREKEHKAKYPFWRFGEPKLEFWQIIIHNMIEMIVMLWDSRNQSYRTRFFEETWGRMMSFSIKVLFFFLK